MLAATKREFMIEENKEDILTSEANEVAPNTAINESAEEPTTEAEVTTASIDNNEAESESKTAETTEESRELTEEEKAIEEAKKDAKWYVLHTFSGYENVAKENLEIVRAKYNLNLRIFDIVIPMEDVVEEKDGKRKLVTRKLMPGYILVKMNYGDDIWHAVTRTRGITGFVGPNGRPLHLTEEEIRKMHLEKVAVVNINLNVGDTVEILDGALAGFVGKVMSIDDKTNKCRVIVEMFGRETPVDVSLDQVKEVK